MEYLRKLGVNTLAELVALRKSENKKVTINGTKPVCTTFIADNDPVPELCNCRHAMAEFGGFKL